MTAQTGTTTRFPGGAPFTVVSQPFMALRHDDLYWPHVAVVIDWEAHPPTIANRPIVSLAHPVRAEAVWIGTLGVQLSPELPSPHNDCNSTYRY